MLYQQGWGGREYHQHLHLELVIIQWEIDQGAVQQDESYIFYMLEYLYWGQDHLHL